MIKLEEKKINIRANAMRKIIVTFLILFIAGCSFYSDQEMETIQQIDRELNLILTSTEFIRSSNPYDYVQGHPDKFDYIVSQKDITLNHFLNKFLSSHSNGLEEYIMATVCVEILGAKNPVTEWSTGREWYEKYSSGNL